MKKRKNLIAKITAGIALGAILIGVVGTGILVIFTSNQTQDTSQNEITEEQLNQLIEQFSGSVDVSTGSVAE